LCELVEVVRARSLASVTNAFAQMGAGEAVARFDAGRKTSAREGRQERGEGCRRRRVALLDRLTSIRAGENDDGWVTACALGDRRLQLPRRSLGSRFFLAPGAVAPPE